MGFFSLWVCCAPLVNFSHHLRVFVFMRTAVEVETEVVNEIEDGKIIITMNEYEKCSMCVLWEKCTTATQRRAEGNVIFLLCGVRTIEIVAQTPRHGQREEMKKQKKSISEIFWMMYDFSFELQSILIQLDCCKNGKRYYFVSVSPRFWLVSSSAVDWQHSAPSANREKQIERHGSQV